MDKDHDRFFEEELGGEKPYQPTEQGDNADEFDDDLTYFVRLLDYLERVIEHGSVVPLTNRRIIDAGKCMDIIQDLRKNIDPAIQYAQQVLEDSDTILANAERTAANKTSSAEVRANAAIDDADMRSRQMIEQAEDRAKRIIDEAEIRARSLVDNNAIKLTAQNEARNIVNDARAEANERRLEASAYGENLLHNVERELLRAVEMVRNRRQNMTDDKL